MMMNTRCYIFDIDGTIATPQFFHADLQVCKQMYLDAGIVSPQDVENLEYHQQLFLLPHVLITHQSIKGAVEVTRSLNLQGFPLHYFTVRQAFDLEQCKIVHANTRRWLEQCGFAEPGNVQFFWKPVEKLTQALKVQEEQITLIDDRPGGLIKAYQKIATIDPSMARQIRERITLVAYRVRDLQELEVSDMRVIPLLNWSQFAIEH